MVKEGKDGYFGVDVTILGTKNTSECYQFTLIVLGVEDPKLESSVHGNEPGRHRNFVNHFGVESRRGDEGRGSDLFRLREL